MRLPRNTFLGLPFLEPAELLEVYVDLTGGSHGEKRFFVAGCLLALGASTPAFSQSVPERTGVNATLGIAPKTEDFVKEVAISDMFEIESSKLAQQKGNSATKASAQMVTDHSKTTSELKGLVSGGKVKADLPAAMDDAHRSKLDKLSGLNGGTSTSSTSPISRAHIRMPSTCSIAIPRAVTTPI